MTDLTVTGAVERTHGGAGQPGRVLTTADLRARYEAYIAVRIILCGIRVTVVRFCLWLNLSLPHTLLRS